VDLLSLARTVGHPGKKKRRDARTGTLARRDARTGTLADFNKHGTTAAGTRAMLAAALNDRSRSRPGSGTA
jgi:hypothetical protein